MRPEKSRENVDRRSPTAFLALLAVFSVPFWVLGGSRLDLPVALPVGALMAVCPLAAAVVLLVREGTWGDVRRLLRSCVDPRGVRPRALFLPLFLLLPAVTALAGLIGWLAGRPQPVPDAAYLLVAVPTTAALGFVGAVCEEAGWTGYLQGALQRGRGALGAAVVVGVVWATWHLPGWYLQLGHDGAWTAGMWVATVALRVLIVWLWLRSGGSVFAAVLVHLMTNVCALPFPAQFDPVIVAPLLAVAALVVVPDLRRAERLSRRTPADPRCR
ncbi:MAG TPA: CPBP family intramembrane glutamic endopeptidase [Pseudonocardia sp.]|jgi:hypothetical protein|uniref:CPBP family intramembrane glutamic endopeptidase n=1 Tax=Pseudonocardia sp. TaxID=60912 RepID=UPI002B4AD572|nr:CPBP family intramembrane glutamic endopeptidase [Pseudonocardia sp.]HLU57270.1 CPBP family intramembrane glutamic endopeptidase [Pseudonocardia sp.]